MSLYESTTLILSIFTITLSMVSILIAIGSSRQTSREATKQIEAIRESSKKDIEHQAKLVWGIIQVAYMQNMFELSRDKNQLIMLKRKLTKLKSKESDIDELKSQEELLHTQIKNREISNRTFDKLIKELRNSTNDILFEYLDTDKN